MFHAFGKVSLSQTMTLLALDLGADTTPTDLTRSYIEWAILIPVMVTATICFSIYLKDRGKMYASLAVLCALIPGIVAFSLKVNFNYFDRMSFPTPSGGNIFDQYRSPSIPGPPQGKSLNVIWIFVESLEKDYKDEAIDGEIEKATDFMTPLNVSPLLNRYTVGGVMSAKCGAPIYFTHVLVLHFHYAGFNNATCFDDVLRHYGYDAYFVVGHDASLSGFRGYYEKHAAAKIYDQRYLESRNIAKDSDFSTYPDEKVFATALDILNSTTLKKPYSLNILTLDNHAPSGYPSRACKNQYGTDIANVIRCDNHSLAEFIQRIRKLGILQDTVLVVMGDHPYMGAFGQLPEDPNIFAKIYTPIDGKKVLNNNPSPFDLFPSVLSAMGFGVQKQQYGYGYSLYDVSSYPASAWKNRLDSFASSEPTERYKALQ